MPRRRELDTHPGPVREKLVEVMGTWLGLLERRVPQAQEAGELDPAEDPALLALELEQARRAIRGRLERARRTAAQSRQPCFG